MVCFDRGGVKFTHRTAGIIIRNGRVLLTRGVHDPFWYLPGGRVELGENAREALARELREELGVSATVGRLIWVVENFFRFEDQDQHEVGLYFDARIPDGCHDVDGEFSCDPEGDRITFEWSDMENVGERTIYPSFLQKALGSLPAEIEHIVHVDAAVD